MRYLTALACLWLLMLTLGSFPAAWAGVPTDSLWLKAVALADVNDDLVPGSMRIRMQEVDKGGNPKKEMEYHEVWSTLSLGEDGEVRYEVVRVVENGEDITEKQKAKEREEAEEENDEESESHKMESYSPFAPDSQERISIESVGLGGPVGGKNTVLYAFTERIEGEVTISGRAWLEAGSGIPVRIEYSPDPLPKRVKEMATTVDYEFISPDSLIVKRMFVDVTGGILFIKKRFHMDMSFDDYWRLPEEAADRPPGSE